MCVSDKAAVVLEPLCNGIRQDIVQQQFRTSELMVYSFLCLRYSVAVKGADSTEHAREADAVQIANQNNERVDSLSFLCAQQATHKRAIPSGLTASTKGDMQCDGYTGRDQSLHEGASLPQEGQGHEQEEVQMERGSLQQNQRTVRYMLGSKTVVARQRYSSFPDTHHLKHRTGEGILTQPHATVATQECTTTSKDPNARA